MKKYLALILVSCFVYIQTGVPAYAADETLWDIVSKRPEVKITEKHGVKTITLEGDIRISDDGTAVDKSGLGALKCALMVYSEINNLLHACYEDSHENYKKSYGEVISRIEDFVVENSLTPVTKEDVRAEIQKIYDAHNEGKTKDVLCLSEFLPPEDAVLDSVGVKKLNKSVDKLLSVPRAPVMQPCL